MKITTKFAQDAILNKNGINHLQIEVTPPKSKKVGKRKPILMIFAIDRSGSMNDRTKLGSSIYSTPRNQNGIIGGYFPFPTQEIERQKNENSTKMDYAINATTKFIDMLTDKDMFGVVSFDDMAFTDQPLIQITHENKSNVISNIRRIFPRGMTNISDALKTAQKMITSEHLKKYNCKIILLSDGQANQGVSNIDGLASIALDCMKQGITISSLGIGLDYDSKIMNAIATSGGGLFYHIEDLTKLENIFKDELDLSSIITAKNVKIQLEIPELIELSQNLNGYVQNIDNNNIEILMGDMYNSRKIFFEIRNNFTDNDINFNIKATYINLKNEEKEISTNTLLKVVKTTNDSSKVTKNDDIINEVISLIKNKTIMETSSFYENGDKINMRKSFDGSIGYINNICTSYSVSNANTNMLLSEIKSLDETYTNNKADKSYTKAIFASNARSLRE